MEYRRTDNGDRNREHAANEEKHDRKTCLRTVNYSARGERDTERTQDDVWSS